MKTKQLAARLKESSAKGPYSNVGKEVFKILDKGNRAELLKHDDAKLVHLIQQSPGTKLAYAPTQRLLPYVQQWRKKA